MSAAMRRPFLKMNGLGNDFVVVEARSAPFAPTAAEVRAIASRDAGVGTRTARRSPPAATAPAASAGS
jgi:diaminopimelate epimerase